VVEDKLRARGVMVDTCKPDVMRVAPAPLYNSFEDVRRFAKELISSDWDLHTIWRPGPPNCILMMTRRRCGASSRSSTTWSR
jgi:hypothetical protein